MEETRGYWLRNLWIDVQNIIPLKTTHFKDWRSSIEGEGCGGKGKSVEGTPRYHEEVARYRRRKNDPCVLGLLKTKNQINEGYEWWARDVLNASSRIQTWNWQIKQGTIRHKKEILRAEKERIIATRDVVGPTKSNGHTN